MRISTRHLSDQYLQYIPEVLRTLSVLHTAIIAPTRYICYFIWRCWEIRQSLVLCQWVWCSVKKHSSPVIILLFEENLPSFDSWPYTWHRQHIQMGNSGSLFIQTLLLYLYMCLYMSFATLSNLHPLPLTVWWQQQVGNLSYSSHRGIGF